MDPVSLLVSLATILAGIVAVVELYEWLRSRKRKAASDGQPIADRSHAIPRPPQRQVVHFVPRHSPKGRDLVQTIARELSFPFLFRSSPWGLRSLTKVIARAARHDPQRGGIVLIWGAGGAGKTTLALEIVQRVYPSPFAGGVIWVSAKWRENFGLAFLIKDICTQFGRREANRALARSLLGKMPCLLVIDDFETISNSNQNEITDFLTNAPRECRVLIISRDRQNVGDGITFSIGTMSLAEAKEFLQWQIEVSPEREKLAKLDRAQIMDAAECNPTVMRWILTQVEDGMLLDDILNELVGGKGEAAEQVCGLSFRLLPRDGQKVLLALSLFAPTADRQALAATCGFHNGVPRVNTALKRLTRLALVESDDYNERFGLAGLTRDWAQAQLDKTREKKARSMQRFIAYFLAYAEQYSDMRAGSAEALRAEVGNIMRAWDYSRTMGDWQSAERFKDVITTITLQLPTWSRPERGPRDR